MKILVVDDDSSVLELLQQILTHSGYHEITTAHSAKSALGRISDADPAFDCFLVDIQMPEVDGIALVKLIRQTPGHQDSPIVMLTAMHERVYLDKAFAAGATDYVTKPFELDVLRRRIVEAHRIVHEKAQAAQQPMMAGQFRKSGSARKSFALAQPIPLQDKTLALGHQEFENYVVELADKSGFDGCFRAAKIADVESHYKACTSEDFFTQLGVAAQALRLVMIPDEGALSYRGNGTFLCLCKPTSTAATSYLEDAVAQELGPLSAKSDVPVFRLLIGDPVRLKKATADTILELMATAAESVEQKSVPMKDVVHLTRRILTRRRTTEDQRRLDQKAYQRLLQSLMHRDGEDAWTRKLKEREDRVRRTS